MNIVLTRAGGGHSFGGGGGGGGGHSLGGGGGHSFFFFGGGGGGAGIGILFVVIVVVAVLALVFMAQRRRLGGEPLMPPSAYPHTDAPAMPGGWSGGRFGSGDLGGGGLGGSGLGGGGLGGGLGEEASAGGPATGLAAIEAHDPAFNQSAFLSDVERAFFTVEEAWTELKPDMSRQVMADGVWQQHKAQIEGYEHNGTRNVLDGLALGKASIISASSDQTYDMITVRLLAACADYDIDVASGKVVRGNKHDMSQWQEDWTFQRSSSATTKADGGTLKKQCPNCGAPLDLDLAGVCKFCKAPVMSGDYDWVLSRIDQVL